MVFSDYIWQEFTDTGISTGSYILFYYVELIDHCTHVSVPFDQYSTDSEYNVLCTSVMDLSHFRMLNNYFFNKDTDVVP